MSLRANIIIFDLDGTLIDTAPDLCAAANHTLKTAGIAEQPFSFLRNTAGFGARALLRKGAYLAGVSPLSDSPIDREDHLIETFLDYYSRHIAVHSSPYDGAADLLEYIRDAGGKIALCTNKPHGLALKLLDTLRLRDHFDVITGGDSFPFKKPDPRHILETVNLTAPTGQPVMVGDSRPDMEAAKRAGIPGVFMLGGYGTLESVSDPAATPDYQLKSLRQLKELLIIDA